MLLAQAESAGTNPILPATNEAVWSVISLGLAVLTLLALVLFIRWASFNFGSQIGRGGTDIDGEPDPRSTAAVKAE